MTNQGTVAPRERVNIVYRPARGEAQEEVELPLKMLVLGDFTGAPDGRPLEERQPVSIDKDNFDDVLRAHHAALDISVPNRLTGDGGELDLHLRIESMKDFGPEAIVETVPELKRLLALREALRALKAPLANAPEFRRKIQELIDDDSSRQRFLAEVATGREEAP